jgi:hypothetical protein
MVAVAERLVPGPEVERRDPMTFKLLQAPPSQSRVTEIRGRFEPERWAEFQRDVRALFAQRFVADHGNTGSPAWGMIASLFTERLPSSGVSRQILGALDLALLALLTAAASWAFGPRAAALAAIVGTSVPLVSTYLVGSILRMDWLCALGVSLCLFEKRFFRAAGLVLGYAVASKLLAGVFVLPFGLAWLIRAARDRRVDRDQLRYIGFAVAGLALSVALSAAYYGDAGLWRDYADRMRVTLEERYYRRNHSLRDLFLQAVDEPASLWTPWPRRIVAAEPAVSIDAVRVPFALVQTLFVAGLAAWAARQPARVAFAVGPLAVFVLLVSNRYYWQMWMLSAMVLAPTFRRDRRHALFLGAILVWLAVGHAVELSPEAVTRGGYVGSWGLAVLVALLGVSELARRRSRDSGGGIEGARLP